MVCGLSEAIWRRGFSDPEAIWAKVMQHWDRHKKLPNLAAAAGGIVDQS